MVDFTETKTGESSGTMAQMRILEIILGNTDRKLDGNNYLH